MGIRHLRNGSPEFLHSLNFFKYGSSVWDLKLPFIYNKALKIGPVDILHCHFGSNGIIGAHLKRLGFCKKLVVTFHGLDVSKVILTKKKSKIYKDLFDQADLILPISNLWREALVSAGAPKQKTFVHHLGGVDVDHIPTKVQKTIASPKIRTITTARFTEKKGLPVALRGLLSTQHSGTPELIENGHSGILVEERNHHQLADAIIRLAKCHKLRNQLAYNGRKTIEQDFNANKQNKGLIDLYKQILTS